MMRMRFAAIPLLAAAWIGLPTSAAAQEPEVDARASTLPAAAEPKAREARPRVAPVRFKGASAAGDAVETAEPVEPAANATDERRGHGRSVAGRPSPPPNSGDRGPSGPGNARQGPSRPNDGGNRGAGSRPGPRPQPPGPYRNTGPAGGAHVNVYARPYYPPAYYDRWARGIYGWSPLSYAPWAWIYGTAGYASFGFSYGGYGAYPPYGGYAAYGASVPLGAYAQPPTFNTGGVRLRVRPRDAQVFVNGYYAGLVDDFDGTFQKLRLDPGGHTIDVRMPGYETLTFAVHVQPGHSTSLKNDLRPMP